MKDHVRSHLQKLDLWLVIKTSLEMTKSNKRESAGTHDQEL